MKSALWLLIGLGSVVGGLIPVWLGASYLSAWGFLGSTIGAIAGLYVYKYLDL